MSDSDIGAVRACRLWERQGAGGPYLSGVWGGARVLVVQNREKADDADAGWQLVLIQNDNPAPRKPPRKEQTL